MKCIVKFLQEEYLVRPPVLLLEANLTGNPIFDPYHGKGIELDCSRGP